MPDFPSNSNISSGGGVQSDWSSLKPTVNAEAEFFEIVNDFGNPLEALREAISNAMDWGATHVSISFDVAEIDGAKRLVITIVDDGAGMSRAVLERDFWGLGYSLSRGRSDTVGEKGHGTKIFFRSEQVAVRTQDSESAHESICDRPLAALSQHRLHEPRIREIQRFKEGTGTEIKLIGYNDNERSRFKQEIVRDYLLWFTRLGSIERIFGRGSFADFTVDLRCLDRDDFERIPFGHYFPPENDNIEKLFDEYDTEAADHYVKYWKRNQQRLSGFPEVTFDAFISVEGDEVKRTYNPLIRERRGSSAGTYRVSDRYGLWLCKDYIPIVRVNEWVTGFGSGSNAFVLLHGFINCQELKLTANRGAVANTNPAIMTELQEAVQEVVAEIDSHLIKRGVYTLRGWQQEHRTMKQEAADYSRRVSQLRKRRVGVLGERLFMEPSNEAELFGFFVSLLTLHPELFDFELLDYNTNRGIDVIGRAKTIQSVRDSEYAYVELKFTLRKKLNHSFKHLRWIVCWNFDANVDDDSEFTAIEGNDVRYLRSGTASNGQRLYFLDNPNRPEKIQVIKLRELAEQRLGLTFSEQRSQAT